MSGKSHTVKLELVGPVAFEASATSGGSLIVEGAADIGGQGRGMRPMEVLLSAIASCAAMDVLLILRKQRQTVDHLSIEVQGLRADATPAPFTEVTLVFHARGEIAPHKLERAVALSVEKYCSVEASLDPAIKVSWQAHLVTD